MTSVWKAWWYEIHIQAALLAELQSLQTAYDAVQAE